jgi:hypothetical protein
MQNIKCFFFTFHYIAIETCSCKSKPTITKPTMIDKNVNTDVELTIELDYDGELPDTNNKHDVMIIEQKKVADLNEKVKKYQTFLHINLMLIIDQTCLFYISH